MWKRFKDEMPPKDGTPFAFLYEDFSGGGVLEYALFVDGRCSVEDCDGGFYHVDDATDFVISAKDAETNRSWWAPVPKTDQ